jgi:hypothetical protein
MPDCTYCTKEVDTNSLGFVILSDLSLEQQLSLYEGEIELTDSDKVAHSECFNINEGIAIA